MNPIKWYFLSLTICLLFALTYFLYPQISKIISGMNTPIIETGQNSYVVKDGKQYVFTTLKIDNQTDDTEYLEEITYEFHGEHQSYVYKTDNYHTPQLIYKKGNPLPIKIKEGEMYIIKSVFEENIPELEEKYNEHTLHFNDLSYSHE